MLDAALRAALQKKYGREQVFVVPFDKVKQIPDRYSACGKLPGTFLSGSFILRSDAEYNIAAIQLIPYILILNKDHTKIYVTKRIAGEERLKDSLSLGCGGHINPCDFGENMIMHAAQREMNEELDVRLRKGTGLKITGLIRDLASETKEHLGIVMIAEAVRVKVREDKVLKGKWMDFNALIKNYLCFESWARHIIDQMLLGGRKISALTQKRDAV